MEYLCPRCRRELREDTYCEKCKIYPYFIENLKEWREIKRKRKLLMIIAGVAVLVCVIIGVIFLM